VCITAPANCISIKLQKTNRNAVRDRLIKWYGCHFEPIAKCQGYSLKSYNVGFDVAVLKSSNRGLLTTKAFGEFALCDAHSLTKFS